MALCGDYATVRSEGATGAMSARAALKECAAATAPPARVLVIDHIWLVHAYNKIEA